MATPTTINSPLASFQPLHPPPPPRYAKRQRCRHQASLKTDAIKYRWSVERIPIAHQVLVSKILNLNKNPNSNISQTTQPHQQPPSPSPHQPISPPQLSTPIHFSQAPSPPKVKTDKGKDPMGTSSSYEPEYMPINLDLLQAQVCSL
ncbi:hypothetical protein E3N88_38905 [Mikania micrantha]|uniref:Uncharacterized protein n=1 Tax=Mikania micrantha TaxID=192012 RepID=A0A5N6LVB3_9ASTR|nr:hypothetical protein E3N88_38905 [Mikania micrantha]